MEPPVLIKPIPAQIVNEQAAYGPFKLSEYFAPSKDGPPLRFHAELKDGKGLPQGLICTADGLLTGIPAKGTQGFYDIIITASNDGGTKQVSLALTIKPVITATGAEYWDELKAQVWQAMGKNQAIPELNEFINRPVTPLDVQYLLERWGTLTIWDAFNLEPPFEKKLLHLEGASEHYHIYDRVSCLIACPVDLFSHERTTQDAIKTIRVMAQEAYKRNWTIELVGLDKFVRAAWVEWQHLGDKHGKYLDVINFNPSSQDVKLYTQQAIESMRMSGGG